MISVFKIQDSLPVKKLYNEKRGGTTRSLNKQHSIASLDVQGRILVAHSSEYYMSVNMMRGRMRLKIRRKMRRI